MFVMFVALMEERARRGIEVVALRAADDDGIDTREWRLRRHQREDTMAIDWRGMVAIAMAIGVSAASTARAEQGFIGGAEVGAAVPVSSFKKRVDTGGTGGLFAGYMFNDYIGLIGDARYTGFFATNRPGRIDDGPQVLGFHAGPRLAVPFDLAELPTEVYASWLGGVDTGLIGDTPISRTSWAHSVGAGLNFRINRVLLAGIFGRYNWVDQRVEPDNGIEYVTAGLALTYNAASPPPPPPPAEAPPPESTPVVKKKIVLRGVHFDFDKATIRADARPLLDRAVATLREEGAVTVIAEGHTDSYGSDEYNQRLSERRAKVVRDYLVDGGIAAERITYEGMGESKPVASNASADGRSQNRRVELKIRNGEP